MKTVYLEISGKVQGVFFRARAKEIAEKYEISGWIRNRNDGKVEACVSGAEEALQKFIVWSKKGPDKARVDNVSVIETPLKKFDKFEVIR